MVEDGDIKNETDDTNDGKGKEGSNADSKDSKADKGITDLDRAEKNLEERKKIVEEEKKILDRKEKLAAIQMVGGQTVAGEEEKPKKEETNHEYRVRIQKEMSEGKTEFKEDGN